MAGRLILHYVLLILLLATAVIASAQTPGIDGIWLGTLQAGSQSLRIQLQIKSDDAGKKSCTLDSLDQGAMGLGCANVEVKGSDISFDVPVVHGHWEGKLSPDGNTLDGIWSQGAPLPLKLTRQAKAIGPKPNSAQVFDPALPPVSLAELQSVLDRDLAGAVAKGELAPGTGSGIVIGVIERGGRRICAYGTAKPDSIFEIGSVTKTFTGLILAQMTVQGEVKLEEPVRELLPPGTVAKPSGAEITLLDLATQHSGLPRLPDNLKPADPTNPYADYRAANLYTFLSQHGVAKPAQTSFLYSNLGVGLLGQALADRAGKPYPMLLAEQVTIPLHLADTVITLSPSQRKRFMQGYDGQHKPAPAWDLDALAGAGAIRSTANDMLSYLEANLRPDVSKAAGATGTSPAATLPAALALSHELRADVAPNSKIALAWLYDAASGNYWHNGATGGYSSFVFFNPKAGYAAVVLFNGSIADNVSFSDKVGEHISQRLSGQPALSLAP